MSDVVNDVVSQYEDANKPRRTKIPDAERLKKYFSANLAKGKNDGNKKFRILPPKDGKRVFEEAEYHVIKLGADWKKMYCPKKNGSKKDPCPLCEINQEFNKRGTKEDKDIAKQYMTTKFWIVKGIDREREDDGPKFWRFRHNYKKQGNLDKIVPIFSTKQDITHPETGRDLILVLGRDDKNYSKVVSVMPEDSGPLHKDPEIAKKWLEDPTTSDDVYSKPSFEYLDIVAKGSIPYWDKDNTKWITKEEWESKNTSGVSVETVDENGEAGATIGGGNSTIADEASEDVDAELNDLPF